VTITSCLIVGNMVSVQLAVSSIFPLSSASISI
jgi:hypothetical protein